MQMATDLQNDVLQSRSPLKVPKNIVSSVPALAAQTPKPPPKATPTAAGPFPNRSAHRRHPPNVRRFPSSSSNPTFVFALPPPPRVNTMGMAKLLSVYRVPNSEDEDDQGDDQDLVPPHKFGRRQMPLAASADSNVMMVMDLGNGGLTFDRNFVRGRELEEFTRKYELLSTAELRQSLEVSRTEFLAVLSQSVPCVGCRRSVERLFLQFMHSGQPTIDPICITPTGVLTVSAKARASPLAVAALLHKHQSLLDALLEQQPRNKKSSRCTLHSLDSFRSRPFSDMWREVWGSMRQECRDEIAHIDSRDLHNTLDGYLRKHKFCQECRTKVEKAYTLLVSDKNPNKEKGYVAALYANIKKCVASKHIHLVTRTDFIDSLIRRAEPELNGSNSRHRERHAKTLEIAQEEVLTCIGMFVYERLRGVHMCIKEEQNAALVLAAVSAHALCRSFDTAVETKRGITNLELLYNEISRADWAKKQRQEAKKLKKKQKKLDKKQGLVDRQLIGVGGECKLCTDDGRSASTIECTCVIDEQGYESEVDHDVSSNCGSDSTEPPVEMSSICYAASGGGCSGGVGNGDLADTTDAAIKTTTSAKDHTRYSSCGTCELELASVDSQGNCTKSIDCGYGSDPSVLSSRTSSVVSSPDGSEVACSDGFCNHDGPPPRCNWANNVAEQPPLTLQQMLDDTTDADDDHGASHTDAIPNEVLLDFACRQPNIQAEREKLRQDLRHRFAAMCKNTKLATNRQSTTAVIT